MPRPRAGQSELRQRRLPGPLLAQPASTPPPLSDWPAMPPAAPVSALRQGAALTTRSSWTCCSATGAITIWPRSSPTRDRPLPMQGRLVTSAAEMRPWKKAKGCRRKNHCHHGDETDRLRSLDTLALHGADSGKTFHFPASIAAPAPLCAPPAGVSTSRMKFGVKRRAHAQLGQLHVPHFHRPYHRPQPRDTKCIGCASASCTSSNILWTNTTRASCVWGAAAVCGNARSTSIFATLRQIMNNLDAENFLRRAG
jgi:hypothetical protein